MANRLCTIMLLFSGLLVLLGACSSSDDSSSSNETQSSNTLRLIRSILIRADGSILTTTNNYNAAGMLVERVAEQEGTATQTKTFESNADGQFIRRSDDYDNDGSEDTYRTYEYENSALVRVFRFGPDDMIDIVEVFGFEDGLSVYRDVLDIDDVASSELVDESTGTLIARRTFEYENGRVVTNNIDGNGDGEIDRMEDFSYNTDGTLNSTTITTIGTGATDSATYVYETGPCLRTWGNSSSNFFCVKN